MMYEVVITRRAERELRVAAEWYAQRSPRIADEWYDKFLKSILTLSRNPQRCGLAHESSEFPFDLRELLFGSGRRKTHRSLFAIRPDKVVIHGIRHFAQRDFTPDDL
jgi:plasmid stabilization system protein ParE